MNVFNYDQVYRYVWDYHNKIVPFSKEEFDMVVSVSTIAQLRKGELIYKQGSVPQYGGFVVTGSLRHYHVPRNERKEITTGFQFENSCFGDLRGIFYNEVPNTSLQAMEDTLVFRLDKKYYQYLFDNCKPFARLMMTALEKRCNELMDEMVERIDQEAEERYTNMLALYPQVLQRASQRHIASYLGIKPQSLSRIRKNLMHRGAA